MIIGRVQDLEADVSEKSLIVRVKTQGGPYIFQFFDTENLLPKEEVNQQLSEMYIYSCVTDQETKDAVIKALIPNQGNLQPSNKVLYLKSEGKIAPNVILEQTNQEESKMNGRYRPTEKGRVMLHTLDKVEESRTVTFYFSDETGNIESRLKHFIPYPQHGLYSATGGVVSYQCKVKGNKLYTMWVVSRYGEVEFKTKAPFIMADCLGPGKTCNAYETGFMIVNTKLQTRKWHQMTCDYSIRKTACIGRTLVIFQCVYRNSREVLRLWNSAAKDPYLVNVDITTVSPWEKLPKKKRNPSLDSFHITATKDGFKLYEIQK